MPLLLTRKHKALVKAMTVHLISSIRANEGKEFFYCYTPDCKWSGYLENLLICPCCYSPDIRKVQ